jgi:hypothetical protein
MDVFLEKLARKRAIKKVLVLISALLVGGISCFGAMDSPDFLPPDPHAAPSEGR